MSCCPPNAEKYLAPDYNFVGSIIESEGVELYVSGGTEGKKAIVLVPDIYGWNGGRTRNIADFLAGEGYYVVVPKLLCPPIDGGTDGDGFAAWVDMNHFLENIRKFPYDGNIDSKIHSTVAHVKAQGVEFIGIIGFCWGGWVGAHAVSDSSPVAADIKALLIGHPSCHLEAAFGGSAQTLFDRITVPTLLLPANGDPQEYDEDGSWFVSVKSRFGTSKSRRFPDVEHGFIPRGDINIPEKKEAVDQALEEFVSFLRAHE
eukprot:CAMPEP_0202964104 /NCGR_PEP_ID=MMETSP1396-20130829/8179_1 /ASSEMBLY_ACC=CAM_ASM_000872 /TAXON_ID= /ORGANISM="Pseudokeronopsis sp., Strain Brazil" /LENGTH=258 /DNA_ID=CAMNT_0049685941 /DNA_START=38 /DNA_END=814 /DNA_ORIENTATION=+